MEKNDDETKEKLVKKEKPSAESIKVFIRIRPSKRRTDHFGKIIYFNKYHRNFGRKENC